MCIRIQEDLYLCLSRSVTVLGLLLPLQAKAALCDVGFAHKFLRIRVTGNWPFASACWWLGALENISRLMPGPPCMKRVVLYGFVFHRIHTPIFEQ